MRIDDYIEANEEIISELWDEADYMVIPHIEKILDELREAWKYWKRRYDEGGVADTRLDRFDGIVHYDAADDWDL